MVELLKPKQPIDSRKQLIFCFGTITEKLFYLWLSFKCFLIAFAPVFKCFDQSLNAIKSLLRFDNKQHLWIYSEKQIWVIRFWIEFLSFSKSWDCLEFVIDQSVWNRILACIDFRLSSVTSVILVLCWRSFICVFAKICCVFLRGSRSTILVLVCWPSEVCVLRGSRSFSWLWCKWSRCDCLVDFLRGFWEDWM